MTLISRLPTYLLWGLSLLVALVSWRFLALGDAAAMPHMLHQLNGPKMAFFAHIFFGPVALAVLPIQLSERLRQKRLGLHRWLGRVYAVSILISGVAGLIIAPGSNTGAVAATGFFTLSIIWLLTTGLAVWHAMSRRVADHRRWIIRSAALTFAAVTLRLQLPIGMGLWGVEIAYPAIAWLCWVPNLLVAEWYLRRKNWA